MGRFCYRGIMWDRMQRLHEHHGDMPLEMRILKITEEADEVAEAFIGVRRLNSRKGVCRSATTSCTNSPTSSSRRRWP
jgi:hypothetical protein